jgi:DNA primase
MKPAEATRLFEKVTTYYTKSLWKDQVGLNYLKALGLVDSGLLEAFRIGYSNGSLLSLLPRAGEMIETLQTLGVLDSQAQEQFAGCITVPLLDAVGSLCGLHGHRIPNGDIMDVHFCGVAREVFNGMAIKTSRSLYLTSTIFDALSLWQAGFRNVIGLNGSGGWTECHERVFKDNGVAEVFLCLRNDREDQATATRLKDEVLPSLVKVIRLIRWPAGVKGALEVTV